MRAFLLSRATFIYQIINFLWDVYWRIKKPVRVKSQVISIGNITVGGSGKTSLAAFVAEALLKGGHKTAIVERGYKRPNRRPIVISSGGNFSWEDCGDEPAAHARSIPGITIYVNSNKTEAARNAADDGFEFIVVDDGFQHRRLFRNVDIVCLDGNNPFGNGYLLPSGILREPKKALKRAGAIVIIDEPAKSKREYWGLPEGIPVFNAQKIVAGIESLQGESIEIRGKKVVGFCGLGNPKSFYGSLMDVGYEIAEFVEFRDHHIYKDNDIRKLSSVCRANSGSIAVTTLKDAVKLERIWPSEIPLYYLRVTIKLENEKEFFKLLGV